MTAFQLASLVFFGLVVFSSYRAQIVAALKSVWKRTAGTPSGLPAKPESSPATIDLVRDLVTINDLRSRLEAAGCKEGVDACTVLLRVMIEFDYQSQK